MLSEAKTSSERVAFPPLGKVALLVGAVEGLEQHCSNAYAFNFGYTSSLAMVNLN